MIRRQVKMFTTDGEPVWTDGRHTYWLDDVYGPAPDDGHHARIILPDDPTGHWRAEHLRRAQEQIGVPCEWREGRPVEVGER